MPHFDMTASRWGTSMGTLELNVADLRRFLRHDLAAVGEIFGTSERRLKVSSVRECSSTRNGPIWTVPPGVLAVGPCGEIP